MNTTTNKPVPVINFSDSGKGDVIVLVHGFLESMQVWDDFEDELDKEFRVIRIDLPGHGKSSVLDETHTMEMFAEEIKNILEIVEVKKILLVGHSMGGYASLAFAEKYPQYLKGLVLFHSHAAADSHEVTAKRDILIKAVENDHLGFIKSFIPELFAPEKLQSCKKEVEQITKQALKTPKEGVLAAIRGMRDRKDRVAIMQKLNIPVLYIVGKHDIKVPADILESQVDNSDNAVAVVLEDCGHMGFVEDKEETLAIIRDFAESVFSKRK